MTRFAALLPFLAIAVSIAVPKSRAGSSPTDFAVQLESIRKRNHLPALAGAAVQDGQIVEIASTGYRKSGDDEEVLLGDLWHIGSCTKSMTATLAAMLVEQGYIGWDTTVGHTFADWKDDMDSDWNDVTLYQLLTHRGGAPHHPPDEAWLRAWQQRGEPTAQRLRFVHDILRNPPEASPGTKFIYSNQGYAIAGVMLERATGRAWEELMQSMLFIPLHMFSAGFGAPGTIDSLDEPWGHAGTNREPEPIPPGPHADNPPAIGPAGTVHCSIADLARYAAFHASKGATAPGLLSRASFEKLHERAPKENYSMGWCVEPRDWGGGDVLYHTGSNTMWYCAMWVAPERNLAFVAATNCASDLADDGCDQTIKAMIERLTEEAE